MARGKVEPSFLQEVEIQPVIVTCNIKGCPYDKGYGYTHYAHKHYSYEDYGFAVLDDKEWIKQSHDGLLYKWLSKDGTSSYGGAPLKWDLPHKDGTPGDWAEPDTKMLSTCAHGLHALMPGQRGFGGSGRLFIAESDGPVMVTTGKVVTMRLRLVQEINTKWELKPESEKALWPVARKNLPVEFRRRTRLASVKAIQDESAPLLREWRALSLRKADLDAGVNFTLLEKKNKDPQYTGYRRDRTEVMKELRRLRKSLTHYNQLVYWATAQPHFTDLVEADAVDASPEYLAYLKAKEL